jgi:hypothetical protein
MFSRFGRLVICCDAPPYAVVGACTKHGFHAPLDVRWCRLSQFLSGGASLGVFSLRFWQWLFGRRKRETLTCSCGHPLPRLKKCGFLILTDKTSDYLLGQCPRCHTIFWDDVLPLPTWMEESISG